MAWKQLLLTALVALTISACSDDPKDGGPGTGTTGENGMGVEGDSMMSGSAEPGTYGDLVATVGDRVFFDFNSAVLSDSAQETLKKQAEWLQKYGETTLTIEGHCDERGTREYNLALGERRANAVKNFLTGLGVDAGRVTVISYGKEHPEYLGSNEAAWSKNRRGVTVVN